MSQVAIPVMTHAIADAFGRREQIKHQVRVAGVDGEFVTRLEVRRGASVVADDSFARGDFYSAHVRQTRHRLDVARMQMRRFAFVGRHDVGVVVKKQREHPARAIEHRGDVALDEFSRILDVCDRKRRNDDSVSAGVDRVGEVIERVASSVRGDTGPRFDFLGDRCARTAAFLDRDSRDRLPARVVDAIPFAGGSCGENDVGSGAILERETNHGALLIFEDASAGVENRDDGDGEPRARDVVVERLHGGHPSRSGVTLPEGQGSVLA